MTFDSAEPPRRIFLSPPHMTGREMAYVQEAFDTNWVAPVGPHVDAFEREFAQKIGVKEAVALSSGTAAIHLALRMLGLQRGDEVMCSTFTFSASANPIMYEGARPVFVDAEARSWNLDPDLLAEDLQRRAARRALPKAVIVVDVFGQAADYEPILQACRRYDVPVIEDATEALGGTYRGRSTGSFGFANAFSFNGNKIITTSGGGMLATDDPRVATKARFLSQQARDPAPHYQHSEIGFNYRLSNVLAGIGRAQLAALDERVAARRRNFDFYRAALEGVPGISFMPEPAYGQSTRWLTCVLIDPVHFGATRDDVRAVLERRGVESRPVWKPLHLQPVFSGFAVLGGLVSERIFATGLCLPSGSNMSIEDLRRVSDLVRSAADGRADC